MCRDTGRPNTAFLLFSLFFLCSLCFFVSVLIFAHPGAQRAVILLVSTLHSSFLLVLLVLSFVFLICLGLSCFDSLPRGFTTSPLYLFLKLVSLSVSFLFSYAYPPSLLLYDFLCVALFRLLYDSLCCSLSLTL